jgi:uncharacterized membrane protein
LATVYDTLSRSWPALEEAIMARVEVSTTIKRPVEDVFAVISNVENNPKWSSAALEAKQTSPGPIGVGTTAHFVGKLLGRRIESDSVVTEFVANRKWTFESKSGPFPITGTNTVEPIDGGTRVTVTFDVQPGGFFKLAEPLLISMAKRQ